MFTFSMKIAKNNFPKTTSVFERRGKVFRGNESSESEMKAFKLSSQVFIANHMKTRKISLTLNPTLAKISSGKLRTLPTQTTVFPKNKSPTYFSYITSRLSVHFDALLLSQVHFECSCHILPINS